ncbi:hypothetical protein [Minwuia thermotolerans]|jgi:hypothetical protein|uniref:Uncharacterized protein n=1 Tax=Minwuia thermotolerans TaxID=2056226 RepID=A0A2M9G6G8_9PROT|nr:hypothetical protein [Minwuia thermotolerans]ANK79771.1 MAG: hypothetical protein TEF_02420 [Rhizobiales bacterium NRL2]PJK31307.1 hypothetical protein CVT23_02280 [Minwuia thermotolerans]
MANGQSRPRLMPWVIGVIIIIIADIFIATRMLSAECEAPGFAEFLVLIVVPAVYLALMFLTLRSQNGNT